jgi:hypothetical protein
MAIVATEHRPEANLPLEPLALPLRKATCRVRWQEHTNKSVPDP